MATKLKQPIMITLNTIEAAVWLATVTGLDATTSRALEGQRKGITDFKNASSVDNVFSHLLSQLREQGIDHETWSPIQPFRIAGHEPEFRTDGSVKVGCQDIPAEIIEAFIKRRQEARKDQEWPKYYQWGSATDHILRFNAPRDCMWLSRESKWPAIFPGGYTDQNMQHAKLITRAEAGALIGIANL